MKPAITLGLAMTLVAAAQSVHAAPPTALDPCMVNLGGEYQLGDIPVERATTSGTNGIRHWYPGPDTGIRALYPYSHSGWVEDGLCTLVADLLECLEELTFGSSGGCTAEDLDFIMSKGITWNADLPVIVTQTDGPHTMPASTVILLYATPS